MSPVYLIFKFLHVLAAIVFTGWFLVAAFWKAHADRSGDPRVIAHALDGIRGGDRRFVMPSVAVLVIAGFGGQGVGRIPIGDLWIAGSIVLLVLAAFASMARLVPLQKRMRALAGEAGNMDRALYARLSSSWGRWNTIALLASLVAIGLMVFKPR